MKIKILCDQNKITLLLFFNISKSVILTVGSLLITPVTDGKKMKHPSLLLITFLFLRLVVKQIAASAVSSKAHAAIDRVYDQLSEDRAAIKVGKMELQADAIISTAESNSSKSEPKKPSLFALLPEALLVHVVSFIDNPMAFSMSCRLFWNVVSALTSFRVFHQILRIDHNCVMEGNLGRLSKLIKAFGNRDLKVKVDLISKNLELALSSPDFRVAFDAQIWGNLRQTKEFKELNELILMESQDDSFFSRITVSPHLDAHRRTLLYILASLPLIPELIENFFFFYPIEFVNERTEVVFQKVVFSISERLILLGNRLNGRILQFFAFDQRLIENIVQILIQNGQHELLRGLLFEIPIPEHFKIGGHYYIGGCVPAQLFVRISQQFLNLFDHQMASIFTEFERRAPAHMPQLFLAFCEKFVDGLEVKEIFHVAVLKGSWPILEQFKDFDFSYGKEDSDFLAFLIKRDPSYANQLLNRIPKIASHKAFLLDLQFQSRHFATFNKLKLARIELKRTIACPEITRAHIKYIQDFQPTLFELLLSDSSERISNYFTMNLKGYERKRYKEHPSFTIALTAIDVYYESTFFIKYHSTNIDPEIVLANILIELNMMRADTEEYFEISHGLPSFAKALLAGSNQNEEEILYTPEAASTQSRLEFASLSESFAMNRVIHDGSVINYRLVLKWFEHFGLELAGGIIPIHELKSLIKGAAYNTFRLAEDKKQRFDLDTMMNRDEPFSMTYRFALIILVTQCKGNRSAVVKRVKSIFGSDSGNQTIHDNFMAYLNDACSFYHQHIAFFSSFNFVATNTRSERFLLDFIRQFIVVAQLRDSSVDIIIEQFFAFIRMNAVEERLLRDHLIYFILLASFKI